jgi:DNA polymerase-3 subunit epsilon
VHGLTAKSLRSAPPFTAVAPELVRRLDGAVFVAHNATFDWGFLSRALRRTGYTPPNPLRLCTMRLSRAVAPDEASHRLADVCDRYGVVITQAHDALADAEATAAVLPELLVAAAAAPPIDREATPWMKPPLVGEGTGWPAWGPPSRWRRWRYRWSR